MLFAANGGLMRPESIGRWIKNMAEQKRPNFVIFYTDDQGYGDLSCMGATDFRTPYLDNLAATGARFTNWYSNSPVCSPSRAALMSGQYPCHAGVRSILAGHRQATGFPQETVSLATALKQQGYRTAMAGKWHLGVAEESMPHNHGFDHWFGFLAGCIDYYSHIFYWGVGGGQDPVHDLWEDGEEIYDNGEYMTDLITQRAVDYIGDFARSDDDAPFFLFVGYNAPHYPMHAPQEYLDRFPGLSWDRQIMAAMLSAVDDGVGDVLAALERNGLRDDTCVFFSSDNGPSRETRNWLDGTPDPYYGGTTGQLKGHKFSLYDGGIRMPAIMNWPGQIPAAQVIDEPLATMDVFPTFVNASGGDAGEYELDGRDVMPVLTEGAASPHDAIFWEMNKQTAVRRGPWKLVLNGQLVEGAPPEDDVHLSNLDDDMGETNNLATECPEIAGELRESAESWRADIETHWKERWNSGDRENLTGHANKAE